MTITLTEEEASLVRYACTEMANRRLEDAKTVSPILDSEKRRDLNEMYRRAAFAYRDLAARLAKEARKE